MCKETSNFFFCIVAWLTWDSTDKFGKWTDRLSARERQIIFPFTFFFSYGGSSRQERSRSWTRQLSRFENTEYINLAKPKSGAFVSVFWSGVSSSSWGPSLFFLMFWANFRRWRIFSSSEEVCDVSIGWNYILLSATDNFGLGNEPKLKETRLNYFEFRHHQTVDWRVYTW